MKVFTKSCDNPDCQTSYSTKNTKKRFCSISCKNHTAYLYRQDIYKYEYEMFNQRFSNIRKIEECYARGIRNLTIVEWNKIGLYDRCHYLPYKDGKGRVVLRFGNIGIVVVAEDKVELVQIPINQK